MTPTSPASRPADPRFPHPARPLPGRPPGAGRRVVDAPVRAFHWLFAASFLLAWASGDSERLRPLHVTLGYLMAGLLAFRVVYGLIGPRQARLAPLLRRLAGLRPLAQVLRTRRPVAGFGWRQVPPLATATAVVGLLGATVPLVLTGYGAFHDWTAGEWLAELHEALAQTMLALALAHVGLIAALSALRRRNQALPMLTGRTGDAGPDLVRSNRSGLAVLLTVAALAFAIGWPLRGSDPGPPATRAERVGHR